MSLPQPPPERRLRPVWLVLLVVWCVVIFALSAQPNLRAFSNDLLDLVVRKLAHMATYAVLATLASMTLRQEGPTPVRTRMLVASFCLLYASSDEYHQTFVTGRHGSPVDVAIDMIGVTVALVLLRCRDAPRTGDHP